MEKLFLPEKKHGDPIFPVSDLNGDISSNNYYSLYSVTRQYFTTTAIERPWIYDGQIPLQAIYNPFINVDNERGLYIVHKYYIHHTQYSDVLQTIDELSSFDLATNVEVRSFIKNMINVHTPHHFVVRLIDHISLEDLENNEIIRVPNSNLYVAKNPKTLYERMTFLKDEALILKDDYMITTTENKLIFIIEGYNASEDLQLDVLGMRFDLPNTPSVTEDRKLKARVIKDSKLIEAFTTRYERDSSKGIVRPTDDSTEVSEEQLEVISSLTKELEELKDLIALKQEIIKHKTLLMKFVEALTKHELNLKALDRAEMGTVVDVLKLLKTFI